MFVMLYVIMPGFAAHEWKYVRKWVVGGATKS